MNPSARVEDVAAYILEKKGAMTAMKLQKLVYYAQAWSLVWDEKPLFPARIEAWSNGPVAPALYHHHRGQFQVDRATFRTGDPSRLDAVQRETVDAVLEFYGDKTAQWLSDLSHRELPWRNARGSTPDGENSDAEITLEAMADYYAGLDPSQ